MGLTSDLRRLTCKSQIHYFFPFLFDFTIFSAAASRIIIMSEDAIGILPLDIGIPLGGILPDFILATDITPFHSRLHRRLSLEYCNRFLGKVPLGPGHRGGVLSHGAESACLLEAYPLHLQTPLGDIVALSARILLGPDLISLGLQGRGQRPHGLAEQQVFPEHFLPRHSGFAGGQVPALQ
jgi:hypothetical protein